jgi:hypothetical protein
MAELIKEVTPPKKPDLSNPYQTASPVKPTLQKKPAKKRKPAEERPKQPEKKEVDLSHQTIIEATIPTVRVLHVFPSWILIDSNYYRGVNALAHLRTLERPQRRKQTALRIRIHQGEVPGLNRLHLLVQMAFIPLQTSMAMMSRQEVTHRSLKGRKGHPSPLSKMSQMWTCILLLPLQARSMATCLTLRILSLMPRKQHPW